MEWFIFLSPLFIFLSVLSSNVSSNIDTVGEPLFLTQFIQNGQIEEAQRKALVHHDQMMGIKSYAGYLTIDPRYNSNMFFWYFPPQDEFENSPIILWLNGGPGTTSMLGLFTEHGPFKVTEDLGLQFRELPWTLNHHMIYLDNPVGAGYSYTENKLGYAKNHKDLGQNAVNALIQFFQLFPNLRKNDFFVAGQSYAGRWVPAISHAIKVYNKDAHVKINLKGMAIGNGLTDPINQMNRSDYLFNLGLLDSEQREQMKVVEDEVRTLISQNRHREALDKFDTIMIERSPKPFLFKNLTGMNYYFNILQTEEPKEIYRFLEWIEKPDTRKAIHVGNTSFTKPPCEAKLAMMDDLTKSLAFLVENLLEDHRVMIYTGQLDARVPFTGVENYVKKLKWSGAEEYLKTKRKEWRVGADLAGYTKTYGNLRTVLVRNAGHFVPMDQPLWAWHLISNFVRDRNI